MFSIGVGMNRFGGYSVAFATAISYGLWYILLGYIVSFGSGPLAPLAPLLIMEIISFSIAFVLSSGSRHLYDISDFAYPLLSGIFFAAANYVFYITIVQEGVPFAGSFASAEIIVFTILLWIFSRAGRELKMILVGSVIITAGLILESITLSGGGFAANATLIEYGLLTAVLYGLATFFYYLATRYIESRTAIMAYIQLTEVVVFGFIFAWFYNQISLPAFNVTYMVLLLLAGLSLFASFGLETVMMKILVPLGAAATSTGYILSDLELVPVLFYALITNTSTWSTYAPGILLILAGGAFLNWREGVTEKELQHEELNIVGKS